MGDKTELKGARERLKRAREGSHQSDPNAAPSSSVQSTRHHASTSTANNNDKNFQKSRLDAQRSVNFMYQPPPVPEPRQRPEDAIPDEPQNQEVREFLKIAPTEGLWMPLGKEVKVMQCWRCKAYGHRAGDKECQLFQVGSEKAREFAQIHEDPMASYVKHDAVAERQRVKEEKLARVAYLQQLLAEEEEKRRKNKEKRKKRRSSSSSRSDSPKRKKHKNKRMRCT